jgi:hypothetical protein
VKQSEAGRFYRESERTGRSRELCPDATVWTSGRRAFRYRYGYYRLINKLTVKKGLAKYKLISASISIYY